MALTATIFAFDVDLADHDRGVFESLSIRAARHPSESDEYLVTRLLAYLLEYEPGIQFSRGVSNPDDPAVFVHDLTGRLTTWIDIGTPDTARLHKASKAADRVVVYTHKDPAQWMRQLDLGAIHRSGELALYAVDRALVSALASRLERRMAFSVSMSDRELFVAIGDETLSGTITSLP